MSECALEITGLKKTYAKNLQALKGIDLSVKQGDFFGLLGPNGAGKSTTIGIVTSLVNKTSGKVKIFGYDLASNPQEAKAKIGLVPQEFNFNVFEKVRDILVNQAGYYGIPRAIATARSKKILENLGLSDKADVPARHLSGGMKRRLLIARALVHEPELLILDEPTAGVDIELRRSMWQFLEELNRQGKTIILTTHYLEEAEQLCKNIAIINKGEIVENTTVNELISKLHRETIVLDLVSPVPANFALPNYDYTLKNPTCLEITYTREQNVNDIFRNLSAQNCMVSSLRNKTNRLEELFLSLVGKRG